MKPKAIGADWKSEEIIDGVDEPLKGEREIEDGQQKDIGN
jgi:hypothetical protein